MRFLARLALGVLLTAVSVGLNLIPALQQTGITQAALRLGIIALVLFGLWRGLGRTALPTQTPLARWLPIAVVLVAWQSLAWLLAIQGGWSLAWRIPTVLKPYLEKAQSLEIAPSDSKKITVEVQRVIVPRGRLTND